MKGKILAEKALWDEGGDAYFWLKLALVKPILTFLSDSRLADHLRA